MKYFPVVTETPSGCDIYRTIESAESAETLHAVLVEDDSADTASRIPTWGQGGFASYEACLEMWAARKGVEAHELEIGSWVEN